MTRRGLIELVIAVVAILAVAQLLRVQGRLTERVNRADSTAAARASVALEAERRRQLADSSLQAERQARAAERRRAAQRLAGARGLVDSLLIRGHRRSTVEVPSDTTDPFPAIAHAITAERAACDLTVVLCEQARAAAELRAAAADSSARQLEVALVQLEARWQVALRRAHRGVIRRGAEAAALTACVVAGAGVGARQISVPVLVGGVACALELVF